MFNSEQNDRCYKQRMSSQLTEQLFLQITGHKYILAWRALFVGLFLNIVQINLIIFDNAHLSFTCFPFKN